MPETDEFDKEENNEILEEVPAQTQPERAAVGKKKAGKWFRKIPKDILLSPGGLILVFFAAIIEIVDLIPIPIIDNLWELPLEIIFLALFAIITRSPWQSMVIPTLLERIPLLNDILPTWLIRLFL